MNFTGHTRLTDEQFMEWYTQLFENSPRPWEQKTEKYKKEVEIKRTAFFTFQELTKNIPILPWEVWKEWRWKTDNKWEVSNLGRVRIDNEIQEQIDKPKSSPGYLVLKKYPTILVYHLVANVFLDNEHVEGIQIHHIDNNGYNSSEMNLILLSENQHKAIHYKRKMNNAELKLFLNTQRYSEEKIKLHLTNYKINKLSSESGKWSNGNYYSHILTNDRDNLIDISYKSDFDKMYEMLKPKKQTYFAHLNSSQALCINLFYPICIEKKFNLIAPCFNDKTCFEFEHNEDNSFEQCRNKTQFDFYLNCEGKKAFFEIKYTEQNFDYISEIQEGGEYDKKYLNVYKEQMNKIAPSVSEIDFFNSYQVWRNICHVIYGDVYFVCLKDRKDLIKEVQSAIEKCDLSFKERIHILTIETLVNRALKNKEARFSNHYKEFKEKYLQY